MLSQPEDRTTVVTGAAGAFGRALTVHAAARGADGGACDVAEAELAESQARFVPVRDALAGA